MSSMFLEEDYVIVRCSVEILFHFGGEAASKYLSDKRDKSPLIHSASSFIDFLKSLLNFDEINEGIKSLKETQNYCLKKKQILRKEKCNGDDLRLLILDIFCTDAELFEAILNIAKQGFKDCVKGAFLIQKSWKQYKRIYQKVVKIGGEFLELNCKGIKSEHLNNSVEVSESLDANQETFRLNSINELQAAIAFGYGLFNMVVSLIPPRILQLAHFFGFNGDQELGLQCLTYVCNSQNGKAEMSRLGLLWYHAIIRPMYALDDDIDSGLKEASKLFCALNENLRTSAVAYYFHGLLLRCKGDFSMAHKSLNMALEKPLAFKEIRMFCDYEIGWCHILEMNWDGAIEAFSRVKDAAPMSQYFYVYLLAVLYGVQDRASKSSIYYRFVPNMIKQKTPLTVFLTRKAISCYESPPNVTESLVLLLEIIYLWGSFSSYNEATLFCFIPHLEKSVKDEYLGLKLFLSACIYQRMGKLTKSVECFKTAMNTSVNGDKHVHPHASYELAIISLNMCQFQRAKEYLQKAKETCNGCDFENKLKMKINVAMNKLHVKLKTSIQS